MLNKNRYTEIPVLRFACNEALVALPALIRDKTSVDTFIILSTLRVEFM